MKKGTTLSKQWGGAKKTEETVTAKTANSVTAKRNDWYTSPHKIKAPKRISVPRHDNKIKKPPQCEGVILQ